MNAKRTWWHWFSSGIGVNTAIVLFNAILIGILWNVVLGLVQTERQDVIRAAIDRNDNLAIAFEQYTIRTIENADTVIERLIHAYARDGIKIDPASLAGYTADNRTIVGVVVADEHGNALTTAYSPHQAKQMNVADREHFRVHIGRDSGRLFIGKPVVCRVTGQWVLPLTRRINKADGTFGGVAMALIEPARFTDVLHDARLRPLDVISLVGMDGITRARLRGTTASWGEDISKSALFGERARHPNGSFFATGQLDNVPRFFSYRSLKDYQVMAIVGTAEADVMAEFYRRQARYFWVAGLTSAVIAGFAILLMLALASQRRAAASVVRNQKRAAEEIEFKNTILQTQQDTSLDAILVVAEDGHIISYNRHFIDLWRLPPQLVSARVDAPVLRLVVGQVENSVTFLQRIHYLNEHRDEKSREEVRLKDGRIIDRYSAPVTGADGRYYGRVWYFRDVTERIKADQQFKDLLEAAPDAMVIVNRDAEIVLVNARAVSLFGWSREELLGKKIDILVPERFRARHPENQDGFFAQPRARAMGAGLDLSGLRKDGTEFPVEISLSPLETAEGTLAITAIRDITDRKQAEEQAHRLSERLATTLENITDAFFTVDREWRFIFLNREAERLLARTRAELTGRDLWTEFPDTIGSTFEREYRRAMADNKTADFEEFYPPLNTWFGVRAYPSEQGLAVYFRDITERKRTEIRINRLNRVYAVLSGINALIVRVHDRGEVFKEACRIAVEHGHFEMAWIGILDPATQDVTPVAWAGESARELTRLKSSSRDDTPAGKGAVGRAIRERRPVFNNDILAHGSGGLRMKEVLKLGFRSQLTLPLFENEAVVGTLTMYAREPNFFDEDELRLLTELGGNISFALGNLSRQQKLDKLARIRAVSSEINAAIVRIRDRKALLEETCRIASEQGKFEMIWIGMVDVVKQEIRPVAWAGFSPEIADRVSWKSMTAARGTLSEAILTRKPTVRNDIATTPTVGPMRDEAVARGCRSTACLPLVVNDSVAAVIVLFAPGTRFFDDEELALLNEVAANISFALENIEKEEKIAGLSRIRAVLSRIDALIVRTRDRDELFREACKIAVEAGGFRMSLLAILDRSAMKIVPVASAGKDHGLQADIKGVLSSTEGAPTTMIARAMREKKAVVSNDSQNDPRVLFSKKYIDSGVRSMAILPLLVSDEAVGVLALYSGETEFFDEEELTLLTELCGDIAFAIDHIDKQERLDYLAYYDPLTGLANRTLFLERVAQYMRSAASGGHKLALFLIDVERFKNINDSLGRAAGDALLRQVTQWLTRSAGDANLFARIDADHFAIVMPEVRPGGDLSRLVEKMSTAFLAHPFRLNDAVFRIAIKVGAALFPDDGTDADTLFRNAEAALKKAKASGERYLFYTQKMTEAVAGKLTLENQLRRALDNEEFVLHYQPKVNLVSGKITSAEALIRWNDPRTGLVAPEKFIPVLEETGLIHDVGRWALNKTIEDYLRWRASGLPAVRIAVNVSPQQLRNRGFIAEIAQAIGIDAHAAAGLEIEITESLIMEDVKHNIASLKTIRALGVTITIDDFGTGFSSLSHLASLPVDTLKIDRSFIINMTAAPEGLSLVSTIINLAHSLKLKVVAEGVETEEQSRLLRLLSCDEMQGFLFSKPLPADIFETQFLAAPVVT